RPGRARPADPHDARHREKHARGDRQSFGGGKEYRLSPIEEDRRGAQEVPRGGRGIAFRVSPGRPRSRERFMVEDAEYRTVSSNLAHALIEAFTRAGRARPVLPPEERSRCLLALSQAMISEPMLSLYLEEVRRAWSERGGLPELNRLPV